MSLEAFEWVCSSSLWYQSFRKEREMIQSYGKASSLLLDLYNLDWENVDLTISLSYIGAPRLRKLLLSIGGRKLSKSVSLQKKYLKRVTELAPESKNIALLLSPLHNSLFLAEVNESLESDLNLFAESSKLLPSPCLATNETLRCFGRGAAISKDIEKQLSTIKNTMDLHQRVIIETERLANCRSANPSQLLNLLEEAGTSFHSTMIVFKDLLTMGTKEKEDYILWLELVLETTKSITELNTLKVLQKSDNLLISFGFSRHSSRLHP